MLKHREPYRYSLPEPTKAKLAAFRIAATQERRKKGALLAPMQRRTPGERIRKTPGLAVVYDSEGLPKLTPSEKPHSNASAPFAGRCESNICSLRGVLGIRWQAEGSAASPHSTAGRSNPVSWSFSFESWPRAALCAISLACPAQRCQIRSEVFERCPNEAARPFLCVVVELRPVVTIGLLNSRGPLCEHSKKLLAELLRTEEPSPAQTGIYRKLRPAIALGKGRAGQAGTAPVHPPFQQAKKLPSSGPAPTHR